MRRESRYMVPKSSGMARQSRFLPFRQKNLIGIACGGSEKKQHTGICGLGHLHSDSSKKKTEFRAIPIPILLQPWCTEFTLLRRYWPDYAF